MNLLTKGYFVGKESKNTFKLEAHLGYISSSWVELCRLLTHEVIQPPSTTKLQALVQGSDERKRRLDLMCSFMFVVTLLM